MVFVVIKEICCTIVLTKAFWMNCVLFISRASPNMRALKRRKRTIIVFFDANGASHIRNIHATTVES